MDNTKRKTALVGVVTLIIGLALGLSAGVWGVRSSYASGASASSATSATTSPAKNDMAELGRYEQVVTMPEAVRSNEMKIERNGHEVIITIPKANKNS